ncbi:MAG: acyl-CoA dehydrogenase [Acidimicrobiales bacterium]|nr:acyl-CoA dehydrogenase [Acidimicrobiales bacterium]
MDLQLDDIEAELQAGVRQLCEQRVSLPALLDLATHRQLDRSLWDALGAMGVFSLRLEAAAGGVGLGTTEAVVVYEELGRSLAPGPLVATHLAAGLVTGTVVGSVERTDGPAIVEHLTASDALVVTDPDGLWLVEPTSVSAQPVDAPMDPLTPTHIVDRLPQGEQLGGPAESARWILGGRLLTAALLLGVSARATDAARDYALAREQFGRPIGTFQAVKHLVVDMLVRTELARSAIYAAAATLDEAGTDAGRLAIASAKLAAGTAAVANGKACIQVHGGVGFTWEAEPHLYLKRAWALDAAFGSAHEQADELALR